MIFNSHRQHQTATEWHDHTSESIHWITNVLKKLLVQTLESLNVIGNYYSAGPKSWFHQFQGRKCEWRPNCHHQQLFVFVFVQSAHTIQKQHIQFWHVFFVLQRFKQVTLS